MLRHLILMGFVRLRRHGVPAWRPPARRSPKEPSPKAPPVGVLPADEGSSFRRPPPTKAVPTAPASGGSTATAEPAVGKAADSWCWSGWRESRRESQWKR